MSIVLTHKIRIYPNNDDPKVFYETANNVIYYAIKIMNKAIRMHYLHLKKKHEYEKDTGESFNVKEVYGVVSYQTIINRKLKKEYKKSNIPGDLLEQIVRQAIATFNTNGKEVLSNNASLPTFRRDQPIPVRKGTLNLTKENNEYFANVSLVTREKATELGFTGRRKSFPIKLKEDSNSRVILNRILDGKYQLADSKVMRSFEGKWYLLLSYHQPKKKVKHDKNKIMGIDLGVVNAVTMAITGERKIYTIKGGEITSFRRRIEGRRKSILNQLPVCSENRRGHGRKTLLKPLEKIKNKVENFKNTINHRYSRYIVDIALKYGVGKIQMEDLTGISKRNSFLATWSYYDLQQKIEYKAKMHNIKVVKIDPSYTSQRCNYCGYISRENRKTQMVFECQSCNHRRNADYNASENIALNEIEKIIQDQLSVQQRQIV